MTHVVMIGSMGSGKTTVGTLVAERLGRRFTDTDAVIEQQSGTTIADIFVESGEAHFRGLEKAAVADALAAPGDQVIAVGGGAVLDPDSRAAIATQRVVFLDVGLAAAAERVGLGVSRPLLLGNVRAQLHEHMQRRRPIYLETSTIVVPTDGRTPAEIAADVCDRLAELELTTANDTGSGGSR